ncbi:vacuolar membrane protein-domain-containing protein [Fomes fomentarius]|nr:vacuolar membrane protein-domain-containing protein [Fomes fomentarius]
MRCRILANRRTLDIQRRARHLTGIDLSGTIVSKVNYPSLSCVFCDIDGTLPSINYLFSHAAVYVFALTTMKILVVALFVAFPVIFDLGEWLLSFLGTSDAAQVIFTIGIFPIVTNVLQSWLIDSIVKGSTNYAPLALVNETPRGSLDPDSEPLFRPSEDDNDRGSIIILAGHDIENPRPRPILRSCSRDKSRLSAGEPNSVGSDTNDRRCIWLSDSYPNTNRHWGICACIPARRDCIIAKLSDVAWVVVIAVEEP